MAPKVCQKCVSGRVSPRTPLWKLTTLLQVPSRLRRGIRRFGASILASSALAPQRFGASIRAPLALAVCRYFRAGYGYGPAVGRHQLHRQLATTTCRADDDRSTNARDRQAVAVRRRVGDRCRWISDQSPFTSSPISRRQSDDQSQPRLGG